MNCALAVRRLRRFACGDWGTGFRLDSTRKPVSEWSRVGNQETDKDKEVSVLSHTLLFFLMAIYCLSFIFRSCYWKRPEEIELFNSGYLNF